MPLQLVPSAICKIDGTSRSSHQVFRATLQILLLVLIFSLPLVDDFLPSQTFLLNHLDPPSQGHLLYIRGERECSSDHHEQTKKQQQKIPTYSASRASTCHESSPW